MPQCSVLTCSYFSISLATLPPSINTLTPTEQTVPVGQTAQFVCQPVGIFPIPPITWQRNGGRVPNLARITITQGLLTINDVRPTDAGDYNCSTSTLSVGTLSKTFELMVAQRPFINRQPRPMSVMEVDPILLRCDATGIPTPEILWQFNGNTLGPSDGAIIERMEDTSRLSIFNTSTANSGLYTCVARNVAGTNEHTVSVEIIPQTSKYNITTSYCIVLTQQIVPTFIIVPQFCIQRLIVSALKQYSYALLMKACVL